MANDLVGLLTGISSTQQPMQPIAGTPGFAGMFGAQQAQGLASGLGRIARQGAPSNQERMQEAMSKLDLGSVEGLSTLAKLQQIQGDLTGAAQTAAKIKQFQAQIQDQNRKVNVRNSIVNRIKENPLYSDILPIIESGAFDENPEDLIPLLKKEPIKGASISKPFAGQSSDGSPLMLTVLTKEGQDDEVVEVSTGKPPPKGTTLSTADGTTVEVNLNEETEDAFSKQLGTELAKDLIASREKATTSLLTADVLNNQWELIDNNIGILSGTGADLLRGAGKLLSAAGVLSGEGEELIANTEAYLANAGNLVADVISAFGAGSGLSDADREFAIKMAAGDPSVFTEAGIRRILKLQAKMVQFKVKQHNKKVANSPAAKSAYNMTLPVPEFPWAEAGTVESDIDADTQKLIDLYTKGQNNG